jgi:hypothetical protein
VPTHATSSEHIAHVHLESDSYYCMCIHLSFQAKLNMAVDEDWQFLHNHCEKTATICREGMSQQLASLFDWAVDELNYTQLLIKLKCDALADGEAQKAIGKSGPGARAVTTPGAKSSGSGHNPLCIITPEKVGELAAKKRRVELRRVPPSPKQGGKKPAPPPDTP